MMPNDAQPSPAASEAAPVPAADTTNPPAVPDRKSLWSTAELWQLGAFSVIGLLGFIATFVLIVMRAPDSPVPRTLSDAEIQRLTGPPGARGPAGPAGPRGAAGDLGLRILRSDCATGNCTVECADGEVLLTAYCNPNRTPAAYPTEHSALCRTVGRGRIEVVATCLKDSRR